MDLLIEELLRRYDVARYKNERLLQRRTEEIYGKIPQIQAADSEISALRSRLFRFLGDPEAIQAKIDSLYQKKRAYLKENGLPEDFLEPLYDCPQCRDTGTDQESKERCACFEHALLMERYKELRLDKDNASFENFDSSLFPAELLANGSTQRQNMLQIKTRCEKFADIYPDTEKINLVFTGPSGLGKTYLLKCIAKRLTMRRFPCIFISSYRLFDAFLKYHLDDIDNLRDFYDVPILIIDDLGTEPLMKNVTSEHLFALVNERMKNSLHTLFATNFSPSGLIERYGERIISRMLSVKEADIYPFEGRDIRFIPAKK